MDSNMPTTEDDYLGIEQIIKLIPHRYPFLMIDRVRDIHPGESAIGIKNVTINEQFFLGHFPGKPVMPGVLMIEAMAQTAAVVVALTMADEAEDKIVYFMTVDNARFRKPVTPGDTLELLVKKKRRRGNVWKFDGTADVGGTVVAEATFTAMIADKND